MKLVQIILINRILTNMEILNTKLCQHLILI